MPRTTMILTAIITTLYGSSAMAAKKPLKVYILAGQSNMQGHAKVETFDYIGDDPATAPMLKEMRGPDGKPRVCEKVWISYFTGSRDSNGEGVGKLTAGYGARSDPTEDGGKIGPEYTFGLAMEKAYDGPILIIKTAWGGKSLSADLRPPSAGPHRFRPEVEKAIRDNPQKDFDEIMAEKEKRTGKYYRLMIDHVKKVLADIKRVVPDYDPKQGYEIAGFVWFQGWNDWYDGGTYPHPDKPSAYDKYSEVLADFIRDVRKDLSAPKMPFVIGVMGVFGKDQNPEGHMNWMRNFRAAQAAPAEMNEFKGNLVVVQTWPYWDTALGEIGNAGAKVARMAYLLRKKAKGTPNEDGKMTRQQQKAWLKEYRAKLVIPEQEALWKRGASNAGYHYVGCAKTLAQIGKAFAEAVLKMETK